RLEVGAVEGQSSPEAYELVIDPAAGVRIVGVSAAGVFYGVQSLRDLLPSPAPSPRGGLVLPAIRVVDAPRFGYRGFMLDVARNFQAKPAVLRTLDLLARYKLNVFHMHVTDDEGWRVEIAGLPELTAVGARRGHTLDSKQFLQPPLAQVLRSTGRGVAGSFRIPTTSRSCATRRPDTSRSSPRSRCRATRAPRSRRWRRDFAPPGTGSTC